MNELKEEFSILQKKYEQLTGGGNGYTTMSGFNIDIFKINIDEKRTNKAIKKSLYREEYLKEDFILEKVENKCFSELFEDLYPKRSKISKRELNGFKEILPKEFYKSLTVKTSYRIFGTEFEKDLLKIIPDEEVKAVYELDTSCNKFTNYEYYVWINKAYLVYTNNYCILMLSGWND